MIYISVISNCFFYQTNAQTLIIAIGLNLQSRYDTIIIIHAIIDWMKFKHNEFGRRTHADPCHCYVTDTYIIMVLTAEYNIDSGNRALVILQDGNDVRQSYGARLLCTNVSATAPTFRPRLYYYVSCSDSETRDESISECIVRSYC